MKTTFNQIRLLILLLLPVTNGIFSQDILKELPYFDKIVAGPHIELTLTQGVHERIELATENVSLDNVIIKVRNGTLKIYLEDWHKHDMIKKDTKKFKADLYRNAKVHASVTFGRLRKIVVIGEEEISCYSKIENDKFRLKTYGEAIVFFQSIETKKLVTKLFGENKVSIRSGEILNHKSRLFGENNVSIKDIRAQKVKCASFGENELAANSEKKFKVISFGESEFQQYGSAKIHKIIVLGENKYLYSYHSQ